MQMENVRASISPLAVYYTSNRPYNIVLKMKRILISTDYELEKFQYRKQVELRNNVADLAGPNLSTFTFRLSKEFQINNTKVDFMVFGALNKDVKILGTATLDLGLFEHSEISQFPIHRELKLKIQKAEDPHACISIRILLEYLPPEPKTNRQAKTQPESMNTIKTDSYNRESLFIGRRKQYDKPSAYEISKRNYKQAQVRRENQERSRSKSGRESGSYKKRFQYQYSRSMVMKGDEDEDEPQAPPNKLPQTTAESRGSPMPRMKTPEPISDFRQTPTERPTQWGRRKNEQNEGQRQGKSKNKIKIMVDVYKEHRVIEQVDDYDYQQQPMEIEREQREPVEWRKQRPNPDSHVGKISQQYIRSPGLNSDQDRHKTNGESKLAQSEQLNGNYSKAQPIQQGRASQPAKSSKPSEPIEPFQTNQPKKLNPPSQQKEINQQKQPSQPKPLPQPVAEKKPQTIIKKPKEERRQEKPRDSSENKYKMITDKLAQIESKIREAKKSQSSGSPSGPNKEQSSPNTFKDSQFESQQEMSPGKGSNLSKHINSFNPLSHSTKDIHQSLNGLGSIAEEPAHMSQSGTNVKVERKEDRKEEGRQDRKPGKEPVREKEVNGQVTRKRQGFQNESARDQGHQVYESSVANFSVSERDHQNVSESKKKVESQQSNKINGSNRKKSKEIAQNPTTNEKKPSQKEQPIVKSKPSAPQNKNKIGNQYELQVEPTPVKKQKQDKQQRSQPDHRGCEQKINYLENMLDHQQESHRKEIMQKQLQYRNELKAELAKVQTAKQKELEGLKEENNRLKQREKEYDSKKKIELKDSKESSASAQEIGKLKEDNARLRALLDKLNQELEQSDEKHFEALTSVERKDLEWQKKMDVVNKKNAQLLDKLQRKQQQIRELTQRNQKITSAQTVPNNQAPPPTVEPKVAQSQKQVSAGAPSTTKNYQEEYLAERKKCVNLEGQLRQKNNQLKFLKIKNDNLLQQKKDLQNQIDNIAINNKLQMAKQGSISKLNLEAASVTNSVRVENQVLKEEINSLRKQVQELNGMLQGIIAQGVLEEERVSSRREISGREDQENLKKKYKALEGKAEAYQQEIKTKQMMIAEIINAIFSHGNPELMDKVSKVVGMTRS